PPGGTATAVVTAAWEPPGRRWSWCAAGGWSSPPVILAVVTTGEPAAGRTATTGDRPRAQPCTSVCGELAGPRTLPTRGAAGG
ncbi:hypothetical protein ACKI1I_46995, partial [Streptomyces turgidiscabies]|uniref:hypothetical protein n=1 Tax=Streptomyces turgidiscabies TaxID=85558 RepID=UPI0038F6C926